MLFDLMVKTFKQKNHPQFLSSSSLRLKNVHLVLLRLKFSLVVWSRNSTFIVEFLSLRLSPTVLPSRSVFSQHSRAWKRLFRSLHALWFNSHLCSQDLKFTVFQSFVLFYGDGLLGFEGLLFDLFSSLYLNSIGFSRVCPSQC